MIEIILKILPGKITPHLQKRYKIIGLTIFY
jgi:hypothetical protein